MKKVLIYSSAFVLLLSGVRTDCQYAEERGYASEETIYFTDEEKVDSEEDILYLHQRAKEVRKDHAKRIEAREKEKLLKENNSYYYIECMGYDRCGRKLDPNNTCGISNWSGKKLTKKRGIISYGGINYTYYNQYMGGCFRLHSDKLKPYSIADTWITNEGIKMLGPYVMCAAYTPWYPPGTLLNTPFGMGIVVDYNGHCDLADGTKADIDICTTWGKVVPN